MTNQTLSSKLQSYTPSTTGNAGNEKAVIKAKLLSIVQSLQAKDAENEHIKEILGELKNDHGIEGKIARKVASILHKNNQAEKDEESRLISDLLSKINQ